MPSSIAHNLRRREHIRKSKKGLTIGQKAERSRLADQAKALGVDPATICEYAGDGKIHPSDSWIRRYGRIIEVLNLALQHQDLELQLYDIIAQAKEEKFDPMETDEEEDKDSEMSDEELPVDGDSEMSEPDEDSEVSEASTLDLEEDVDMPQAPREEEKEVIMVDVAEVHDLTQHDAEALDEL